MVFAVSVVLGVGGTLFALFVVVVVAGASNIERSGESLRAVVLVVFVFVVVVGAGASNIERRGESLSAVVLVVALCFGAMGGSKIDLSGEILVCVGLFAVAVVGIVRVFR